MADKNMNVIICGERGAGKSTMIDRLISGSARRIYGFRTRREASVAGITEDYASTQADNIVTDTGRTGKHSMMSSVYIHPAGISPKEWVYTDSNRIGICNAINHQSFPTVFDTEGVRLLDFVSSDGLIIMDELGFMENDAEAFQRRVLDLLGGDIPVIAAVKTKNTVFLNTIRECSNSRIYFITPDNRDAIYREILNSHSYFG